MMFWEIPNLDVAQSLIDRDPVGGICLKGAVSAVSPKEFNSLARFLLTIMPDLS